MTTSLLLHRFSARNARFILCNLIPLGEKIKLSWCVIDTLCLYDYSLMIKHAFSSHSPVLGVQCNPCHLQSTHSDKFDVLAWLNYCGLMTPYGDTDIRRHWFDLNCFARNCFKYHSLQTLWKNCSPRDQCVKIDYSPSTKRRPLHGTAIRSAIMSKDWTNLWLITGNFSGKSLVTLRNRLSSGIY